jgi:hypothetical protein
LSGITWKDKEPVTNFTNSFILTKSTQAVWMETDFDSSGKMFLNTIYSGTPGSGRWNADLRYVSADNRVSSATAFTWYQLLGYLKLSSDPGGSANDIKISGSWYKLMCPTTTHLMESIVRGSVNYMASIDDYIAVVPWYGCQWSGS